MQRLLLFDFESQPMKELVWNIENRYIGLAVAVKVELEIGNAQRECVPIHIGVEKSSKSEKSRKK